VVEPWDQDPPHDQQLVQKFGVEKLILQSELLIDVKILVEVLVRSILVKIGFGNNDTGASVPAGGDKYFSCTIFENS
jgi:hypothetical protein